MFYDSSSGRRNSRGSYSIISYILINYIYSSLPSIDYHSFNGLAVQTPYIINFIHRLYHPSFLQLIPDPWLLSSLAPTIHHWSIACTFQRFFTCSLIHRLYHPSLLLLITDPSLVSSVAPSIDHWFITCTPSLALWSIAWIIRRSFYWSLIHRLYHPALLQLLTDQPLLSSIAISIAQWSIACTPSLAHRSIAYTIKRSFDCSLIHRLLKSQSELSDNDIMSLLCKNR